MALRSRSGTPRAELSTLSESELLVRLREHPVPRHVAIIMDGNGRWATRRGLPRVAGHREGVKAARAVVRAGAEIGLDYVTLYAFSTENWSRPEDEVSTLMSLLEEAIYRELPDLMARNVRLRVIGRPGGVPLPIRRGIDRVVEATRDNTGLTLVMAFNYGARAGGTRASGRARAGRYFRSRRERRPLHARHPRSRPSHPHQRRDARVELSALADRVYGALDHAHAVAGLRGPGPLPCPRRLPGPDPAIRWGVRWRPAWRRR